jgi:hypothetical protein
MQVGQHPDVIPEAFILIGPAKEDLGPLPVLGRHEGQGQAVIVDRFADVAQATIGPTALVVGLEIERVHREK